MVGKGQNFDQDEIGGLVFFLFYDVNDDIDGVMWCVKNEGT